MKKEAEYPFTGYTLYIVLHRKEGRRMAMLVDSKNKKRKTISYARYLMSVHLKRILLDTEHVDHIDDNKLNDKINNLQILTQKENTEKYIRNNPSDLVSLQCPNCNKVFTKPRNRAYSFLHLGKLQSCSRKCSGEYSHKNKRALTSVGRRSDS